MDFKKLNCVSSGIASLPTEGHDHQETLSGHYANHFFFLIFFFVAGQFLKRRYLTQVISRSLYTTRRIFEVRVSLSFNLKMKSEAQQAAGSTMTPALSYTQ